MNTLFNWLEINFRKFGQLILLNVAHTMFANVIEMEFIV